MAGFLTEELANAQITTATTTTLFTVPADHSYIIKLALYTIIEGASESTASYLTLSDAAGANDQKITPSFTTPAAAGSYIVNLAPPNVDLPSPAVLVDSVATTQMNVSLFNATLASGQILKLVTSSTWTNATANIMINGIDNTEV